MNIRDKIFDELVNGTTETEVAHMLSEELNYALDAYNHHLKFLEEERLAKIDNLYNKIMELSTEYCTLCKPGEVKKEVLDAMAAVEQAENKTPIKPACDIIYEPTSEGYKIYECDDDDLMVCNDLESESESTPEEENKEKVREEEEPVISYTYDSYYKEGEAEPVREHFERKITPSDIAKIANDWRKSLLGR